MFNWWANYWNIFHFIIFSIVLKKAGKEMLTHSALSNFISLPEITDAIWNVIAIRWSSNVWTSPDWIFEPPLIMNPSGFSITLIPIAFKFLHIASSLSDSLTLSSSAPLTIVVPSACEAISARIGISSMIEGISDLFISIPVSYTHLTLPTIYSV